MDVWKYHNPFVQLIYTNKSHSQLQVFMCVVHTASPVGVFTLASQVSNVLPYSVMAEITSQGHRKFSVPL
jgi:hypothetical protein